MSKKTSANKRSEVSKRIEYLRKEVLKVTQQDFAEKLGKGRSTVNNWEQGAIQIKSDDLTLIATEYEVPSDWLLGIKPLDDYSFDSDIQQISNYTGLSTKAVEFLHTLLVEANGHSPETQVINALLTSEIFNTKFLKAMLEVDAYWKTAIRVINEISQSEYPRIEASKRKNELTTIFADIRFAILDYTDVNREMLYTQFPNIKQTIEKLEDYINPLLYAPVDGNSPHFYDTWKYGEEHQKEGNNG